MAELKTKPTGQSVIEFLELIPDEQRRQDCRVICDIMREATGAEPVMWGPAIIGFGNSHYKYASGREGDWFPIGFSPRKQNLTLYGLCGFERFGEKLGKLGKHKLGKGCLYINKLSDVQLPVLCTLIFEATKKSGTMY